MYSLQEVLCESDIKVILLDACGVLYDGEIIFEQIPETIKELKKLGLQIRLVTNNSTLPPFLIAKRFNSFGIDIFEDEIISSGAGLYLDPFICNLIKNKCVYVFGRENSFYYVNQACPKEIVSDPYLAEAIVFTDTFNEIDLFINMEKIIALVKSGKKLPLICCNPDRVILKDNRLIPVIGYYVDQIIAKTNATVYWIGKPYKNFSYLVEKILIKEGLLKNRDQVCFFDDNLKNVLRLGNDLQIKTCLIKNTGLAKTSIFDKLLRKSKFNVPFTINKFVY
jgi:4-nitrophenyl phosphatase